MAEGNGIVRSELTEAVLEKARTELGEILERRDEDIQKLRDILKSDHALHCPPEDSFLLMFLRARKFDHQKAARLIRQYYQIRIDYSQFYVKFTPSSAMDVYQMGSSLVLPVVNDTDPRPVIFRPGRWDPSSVSIKTLVKANNMHIIKLLKSDERTQVNGVTVITDLEGMGWAQAKHWTPTVIKYSMAITQNANPIRTKAIHCVNAPRIFGYLISLCKSFMSKKLRDRIHVHSSPDCLKDHFDLSVLPESFGGYLDEESLIKEWAEIMADSEDEFLTMERYGIKKMEKDSDSTSSSNADAEEETVDNFKELSLN